ncbi:hypothetical protein F8A87_12350 [Betaproteobacteria bacterium SCN2]|jgi:hypothetical protein|nr:hypothetical protein F8A87_12350 [Betaproteobacteria bacterium SCN2]
MKKIALFALMSVLSGAAVSGTIAPTTTGDATPIDNAACPMVATSFTFNTSANVGASYFCSTTAGAVQTGSTKGKYVYGGTTEGGGVRACGTTEVNTSTGYVDNLSDTTSGCPSGGGST